MNTKIASTIIGAGVTQQCSQRPSEDGRIYSKLNDKEVPNQKLDFSLRIIQFVYKTVNSLTINQRGVFP